MPAAHRFSVGACSWERDNASREYDIGRLLLRLYPDPHDFLERFPISEHDRQRLAPEVLRCGHHGFFYRLAEAELDGLPYELLKTPIYEGNIAPAVLTPQFRASMSPGAKPLIGSRGQPEGRVRLFDCCFRSFWASQCGTMSGVQPNARVLAMYLPEEAVRIVERDMAQERHDHVYGAFAYLRFYRHGSSYYAAEIQSDVYGALQSRGLREQYKHWSKILLLAFESLAAHERARAPAAESVPLVYLADSAYQRERWPKISPALIQRIYEDLPASAGYEKCTDFHSLPLEQNPEHETVELKTPWRRTLDGGGPLRAEFSAQLRHESYTDAQRWLELEQELFWPLKVCVVPVEGFPLDSLSPQAACGTKAITAVCSLPPEIRPVPQIRRPLDAIPGVDEKMLAVWRGLLEQDELQRVLAVLSPDTAWLDAGTLSQRPGCSRLGSLSNLAAEGAAVVLLQSDSALVVRFSTGPGPGFRSVRIEGGRARAAGRSTPVIGIPLEEAELEFAHTLGLHAAWQAVNLPGSAPAPIPLDIGIVQSFPAVHGTMAERLSAAAYSRLVIGALPGLDERPAVLRSLSAGDANLQDLRQELFHDSLNSPDRAGRILQALELLYAANAEPLTLPAKPPAVSASEPGVWELLHAVYAVNREAAERIIDRAAERLISVLGFVHGAGGHLGAAAAPQHVDLSITVNNLNRRVYLPWIYRSDLSVAARLFLRRDMEELQRGDLTCGLASIYGLQNILRGEAPQNGVPALRGRVPYAEHHAELYARAVEEGKSFRQEGR